MGRQLCEQYPVAREAFDEADSVLGFALSRLCFEGPADTLTETVNAQPAILTASIAALRALQQAVKGRAVHAYAAGHSLGEYTALVASGSLSFADALRLVRLRGELMRDAGAAAPGGMAAVIGLDFPVVQDCCSRASSSGGVVQVANDNAPGQVVISGHKPALDKAAELAKAAGARRVLPLAVSIAAHSPLMESAASGLRRAIEGARIAAPHVPVVGNVDAAPLADATAVRSELVAQLTSPVRWTDSIRFLAQRGVAHFLEIGPGTVLAGLVKRIAEGVQVWSVGDPQSLSQFHQTCGLGVAS
jgi:[acyl-carrier-protein] S-malonyltransferase